MSIKVSEVQQCLMALEEKNISISKAVIKARIKKNGDGFNFGKEIFFTLDFVKTLEETERRREGLADLFDSYMETLRSRSCPKLIIEKFIDQREQVLDEASKRDTPKECIPFLPVIPESYMGIYGLMSMVYYDGKRGYTKINPNIINGKELTPKQPYFLFDVEDGESMLGNSTAKARVLIKQKKRFCLTAEEIIALCLYYSVLSKHYLDCACSVEVNNFTGLSLWKSQDVPLLSYANVNVPHNYWGSPSCARRSCFLK